MVPTLTQNAIGGGAAAALSECFGSNQEQADQKLLRWKAVVAVTSDEKADGGWSALAFGRKVDNNLRESQSRSWACEEKWTHNTAVKWFHYNSINSIIAIVLTASLHLSILSTHNTSKFCKIHRIASMMHLDPWPFLAPTTTRSHMMRICTSNNITFDPMIQ